MYRIGEFSKLTNLSIRTIRYYNDIGLLIPEEVDIFTNYRYYGKRNIYEAKIIEELKSVGFTLEEIKNNWNHFDDKLFLQRKETLLKQINEKNAAIRKVDELRSKISNGQILPQETEMKIKKKSIY